MKLLRSLSLIWLLLGAATLSSFAQTASTQLKNEINRLQSVLEQHSTGDADWKDVESTIAQYLTRAKESVDAGRLYYGLQSIGDARVMLDSYMSFRSNTAALQKGFPEFESHWKLAKQDLAAQDARARARTWSRVPAVVRALSEAAQGQSMTVLEASRAYADVTEAKWGYYYLGEAHGDADFATFAHQLKFSNPAPPLDPRSVAPELARIQTRTDELFQPPLSIEKHGQFIRLNSTIKLARELDAANLRFGALYEYLFAVQQLTLLQMEKTPSVPELRQSATAAKTRFSKSKTDDTIAELFLDKTNAALDPSAHALGTEDQKIRTAAAVLQGVLPAYDTYLDAPAPELPVAKPSVTVTLVRWPYT